MSRKDAEIQRLNQRQGCFDFRQHFAVSMFSLILLSVSNLIYLLFSGQTEAAVIMLIILVIKVSIRGIPQIYPRTDTCLQTLFHCLFLIHYTILPLLSHLYQPHHPGKITLYKKLLNHPGTKARVTPRYTWELQRHHLTAIQKVP